jgi:hypothetical protein
MEKFTHGIMAIDPVADEEDMVSIVHFIGLWQEPTTEQFDEYVKEIKTDPEFGLVEIADRLVILPAPQEIVDFHNTLVQDHEDEILEK